MCLRPMVEPSETGPWSGKVMLSVVVPLFNEADNVDLFLARVEPIVADLVAPLRHLLHQTKLHKYLRNW